MNGITLIIILIAIVFVVAVADDGIIGVKESPIQSMTDSSKTIFNEGKDIVNEAIAMSKNNTGGG